MKSAVNTFNPKIKERELPGSDVDVLDDMGAVLIVWNDDVNTFDWVIQSLIEVCDHSFEQAEQCTLLIHYKGKCDVKRGSYEELVPMKDALHDRGISAEIQ